MNRSISATRLNATSFARPIRRSLTTLGIRREDPLRIWERRAPLTPKAVLSLLQDAGIELAVEVESCARRCFPEQAYRDAGASIVPSLSAKVDLILGIKEPPVSEVNRLVAADGRKRRWMVFSHTHKGQEYNTPLLAAFLDRGKTQTLIDHELLTAPSAETGDLKRVAAFGWYAGAVGAGEALSMTGLALLRRGDATPLLHLARPYTYSNLADFKRALSVIGDTVRATSSSQASEPMVIGLTGAGNVAKGAKDMLEALGVRWVDWDRLPEHRSGGQTNQIFACAVPPKAYLSRPDGSPYSRKDYYADPASYRSLFARRIAPHLTTLINGAGWDARFPRTLSNADIEYLVSIQGGKPKLVAVQDITCDIKGNLEFVDRHKTIDSPYFVGPGGMLISAIDILPTELPMDASEHFSSCILPYVRQLVVPSVSSADLNESLDRASIVNNGQLVHRHTWLQARVDSLRPAGPLTHLSNRKRKVLLLGSGLVASPAVEVFAARSDLHLAVASNNINEARLLVKDRKNVEAFDLDVGDELALGEAVRASDVVVSLLPAPMHPVVARHCVTHGKHLVTASYISPEMAALDQAAKDKDILLLGECGLDPGIDSMAATRVLDRVRRKGKRVTSFVSWCGGLPEPSASNVPLGYKFSWSPRAVLTAALNDARYKLDGKVQQIPGDTLLASHIPSVPLWKGLALEGLANRDALPYADKYGLGPIEGLIDLFRGTLRYQGFSRLLDSFRRLGLLSLDPLADLSSTWEEFLTASISRLGRRSKRISVGDVPFAVSDLVGIERADETLIALQWLSLLPNPKKLTHPVPFPSMKRSAPIDLFTQLLAAKLAYAPHERDTVLLHHTFKVIPIHADPSTEPQLVTASLLCTGTPEASAMSTTVGRTLAFAALRVLDGDVKARGVKGPYEREVWEGVLANLEAAGVRVNETWS